MQQLTGDTYLAGLWKGDLINGLLWQRAQGYRTSTTTAALRDFVYIKNSGTPSWSWAAYDGLVDTYSWRYHEQCNYEKLEELVIIHAAGTELVDATYPTGQVSRGAIEISGFCHEVLFVKNAPELRSSVDSTFRFCNWKREVSLTD